MIKFLLHFNHNMRLTIIQLFFGEAPKHNKVVFVCCCSLVRATCSHKLLSRGNPNKFLIDQNSCIQREICSLCYILHWLTCIITEKLWCKIYPLIFLECLAKENMQLILWHLLLNDKSSWSVKCQMEVHLIDKWIFSLSARITLPPTLVSIWFLSTIRSSTINHCQMLHES